jgi:hypothetical protein
MFEGKEKWWGSWKRSRERWSRFRGYLALVFRG